MKRGSLPEFFGSHKNGVTFSVIVAALRRPSLLELLKSLEKQTLDKSEWKLITWDSGFNEYDARNQAAKVAGGTWLAFTDDDCIVSTMWLESVYRYLQDPDNCDSVLLAGPLEGDLLPVVLAETVNVLSTNQPN